MQILPVSVACRFHGFGVCLTRSGESWGLLCATSFKGGRVPGGGLVALAPQGRILAQTAKPIRHSVYAVERQASGIIRASTARGPMIVAEDMQSASGLAGPWARKSTNDLVELAGGLAYVGDKGVFYEDSERQQHSMPGPHGPRMAYWSDAQATCVAACGDLVLVGRDISRPDMTQVGSLVALRHALDEADSLLPLQAVQVRRGDNGSLRVPPTLDDHSPAYGLPRYIQSVRGKGPWLALVTMQQSFLFRHAGKDQDGWSVLERVATGPGGLGCAFTPADTPQVWVGSGSKGIHVLEPPGVDSEQAERWRRRAAAFNEAVKVRYIADFDFAPGRFAVGVEGKGPFVACFEE